MGKVSDSEDRSHDALGTFKLCTINSDVFRLSSSKVCFRPDVGTSHNRVLSVTILGNCPTRRTNSFQCIYLFIVLYMFRA